MSRAAAPVTAEEMRGWFEDYGGRKLERNRPVPSLGDCQRLADIVNQFLGPSKTDPEWERYAELMDQAHEHARALACTMDDARRAWSRLSEPRPQLTWHFEELRQELENFARWESVRTTQSTVLHNFVEPSILPYIRLALRRAGWNKVSITSDTSRALAVFSKCLARIYGDENAPSAKTLARLNRERKAKTRHKKSEMSA